MARLVIPEPDLVRTNQGAELRLSRDDTDREPQSMARLQTNLAPCTEVVVTTEPAARDYDPRIIYPVEMQGQRVVALDQPLPTPALAAQRSGADPATLVAADRN